MSQDYTLGSFVLLNRYQTGETYPIVWSEYADAMTEIAANDGNTVKLDLLRALLF